MIVMAWEVSGQACPMCDGDGIDPDYTAYDDGSIAVYRCDICNGTGVIAITPVGDEAEDCSLINNTVGPGCHRPLYNQEASVLSADEFLENVARWSAVGLTIGADAPNQTEIDMDDNEYVAPDATAEHSPTLLQRAHKAAVNADVAEARSVDPADEIAFSVMYSLLALAHSAERIATALEGGRPHA